MKKREVLLSVFQVINICAMAWILFLTACNTIEWAPAAFAVTAVGLVLLFLAGRSRRLADRWNRIYPVLWILMLVFMFYLAFQLRVDVNDTWDYGQIIRSAFNLANNRAFSDYERAYYANYPNNQFILLFMTKLFNVFHRVHPDADIYRYLDLTVRVNVILIMISVALAHYTAKQLLDDRGVIFTDLLIMCCSPLYLYAPIMYTDTLALLPGIVILAAFSTAEKCGPRNQKKRLTCFSIAGLAAAVGYNMKMTVIFIAIGVFIYLAVKEDLRPFLTALLCFSLVFAGVHVSIKFMEHRFYGYTAEERDAYEFPYEHWVMMGLQENGRYNPDDVIYTRQFPTKAEKAQADRERIKERVSEMGTGGLLKRLFYKKIRYCWSQGAVSTSGYLCRNPLNPGIWQELFMDEGKYLQIYITYIQGYYMMVLLGMLLSGVKHMTRKNDSLIFAAQIALFGLILFLMVWEDNPRYIFQFELLLCLIGADGLTYFLKQKSGHGEAPNENR